MSDDVIVTKDDLVRRILEVLPDVQKSLVCSLDKKLQQRIQIDDVIQEAFIHAMEGYETFQYQGQPQLVAWLKRISNNVVLNQIRKSKKEMGLRAEFEPIVKFIADSDIFQPSEKLSDEELRRAVSMAIAALPDHHQRVLELRYHGEKSFDEIGRELNKTPAACRGLHRNAVSALRDQFQFLSAFVSSHLTNRN